MSTYRGIIFDLDGTLLDTLSDLADSFNHALAVRGFPAHETSAYRKFVGSGAATAVERALPAQSRDKATIAAVLSAFHEHYSVETFRCTAPYDGIPGLLENLAALNLRQAVLSNKSHEDAEKSVQRYFPGVFQYVYGLSERFPKKPDPEAALHIAGSWGLAPEEVIFLGDSDIDMKTAVHAGMLPVAATWGFRDSAELLAAGAQAVLDTPADLLKLLEQGRKRRSL